MNVTFKFLLKYVEYKEQEFSMYNSYIIIFNFNVFMKINYFLGNLPAFTPYMFFNIWVERLGYKRTQTVKRFLLRSVPIIHSAYM